MRIVASEAPPPPSVLLAAADLHVGVAQKDAMRGQLLPRLLLPQPRPVRPHRGHVRQDGIEQHLLWLGVASQRGEENFVFPAAGRTAPAPCSTSICSTRMCTHNLRSILDGCAPYEPRCCLLFARLQKKYPQEGEKGRNKGQKPLFSWRLGSKPVQHAVPLRVQHVLGFQTFARSFQVWSPF